MRYDRDKFKRLVHYVIWRRDDLRISELAGCRVTSPAERHRAGIDLGQALGSDGTGYLTDRL